MSNRRRSQIDNAMASFVVTRRRPARPGAQWPSPKNGGHPGRRERNRTSTAEATALQAACLANEQPALGVTGGTRTLLDRDHDPAPRPLRNRPPYPATESDRCPRDVNAVLSH
jgi:hypothetical protein